MSRGGGYRVKESTIHLREKWKQTNKKNWTKTEPLQQRKHALRCLTSRHKKVRITAVTVKGTSYKGRAYSVAAESGDMRQPKQTFSNVSINVFDYCFFLVVFFQKKTTKRMAKTAYPPAHRQFDFRSSSHTSHACNLHSYFLLYQDECVASRITFSQRWNPTFLLVFQCCWWLQLPNNPKPTSILRAPLCRR